ncbi:MAG: hypothetical protein Q9P14_03755 [candidate division KSB1 bacterium]|nr:hypothetical protein [candidate division KSB1 bacterium]
MLPVIMPMVATNATPMKDNHHDELDQRIATLAEDIREKHALAMRLWLFERAQPLALFSVHGIPHCIALIKNCAVRFH